MQTGVTAFTSGLPPVSHVAVQPQAWAPPAASEPAAATSAAQNDTRTHEDSSPVTKTKVASAKIPAAQEAAQSLAQKHHYHQQHQEPQGKPQAHSSKEFLETSAALNDARTHREDSSPVTTFKFASDKIPAAQEVAPPPSQQHHYQPQQQQQHQGKPQAHSSKDFLESSFPHKLHRLVTQLEEEQNSQIATFLDQGGIWVRDRRAFVKQVMPKYFRGHGWSSFRRQLYSYQFNAIAEPKNIKGAYTNEFFLCGRPELCYRISRHDKKNNMMMAAKKRRRKNESYTVATITLLNNVVVSATRLFFLSWSNHSYEHLNWSYRRASTTAFRRTATKSRKNNALR
ncbi:hypothetical protein ACA910_015509 [Epithemia clementina (nom. ined.)]